MRCELARQVLKACLESVIECVGHRHQLGWPFGGQGVISRTGAPSAAADQGDLDRILLAGTCTRSDGAGQGRPSQCAGRLLQEIPAGSGTVSIVASQVHQAPLFL